MAGYSGTPLGKKLGIKEGHRVLFLNAPPDFEKTLGNLPPRSLIVAARSRDPLDVIVLFVKTEKELASRFEKLAARLTPAGGLWIGWPKKASGVATDLGFDNVQRIGLKAGLVDNKVCAIDETWSGLRFVIRVINRL
ncbi:MAG: DUF3052 domain-containing protein [Acidobacteriota bacterium]